MKTRTLTLLALAFGVTLALPAVAQDVMKYDPIMEKRGDLRMQWNRAQREGANAALRMHRTGEGAGASVVDRPGLVDFMALSSKRMDLRLRANQIGVVAAYDEWVAHQHGR
jgi:hypothetical protein